MLRKSKNTFGNYEEKNKLVHVNQIEFISIWDKSTNIRESRRIH